MPYKRLQNKPLQRGSVVQPSFDAVHVRSLLSLIYKNVYAKEIQKEELEKDIRYEREKMKEQWLHWRAYSVHDVWKENGCTIRLGLSGEEFYINRQTLVELKYLSQVYMHVRFIFEVPKHISIRLLFCDCRTWKRRDWRTHIVPCCESNCVPYLQGVVLQVVKKQ